MRILKITTLILFFSGLIFSCQKEYLPKTKLAPGTKISFSADLQPILTSQCASSGCHDKNYPPNLLKDKSYSELVDGGYIAVNGDGSIDTLNAIKGILMIRLNKDMPKGKLPAVDIEKFKVWIEQGAKEN